MLYSDSPTLLHGFIILIGIYEKIPSNPYDWVSSGGQQRLSEKSSLSAIRSSLCKPFSIDGVVGIQHVGILIAQQWLQVVMWKLSMTYATKSSAYGQDMLPFYLPVLIGKDVIIVLSSTSQSAIHGHGIGIVS